MMRENPAGRMRALGRWAGARFPIAKLVPDKGPVDLRLVGQTLLRAALIGAGAGFLGAGFFWLTEHATYLVLERGVGYRPLRAAGELLESTRATAPAPFRAWLLAIVPALGALLSGLLTAGVPAVRGGGTDAMIEAFHHRAGWLSPRTIWRKAAASIATLASGGAGGREGPTMFIGGALGGWVADLMRTSARERRVLLVAGAAAGISAVFRTPLGAALLAVEVLYRDGFESDALVPSILASVVSYSVVISIFGESTLFGQLPRFPFVPAHLPLYGLLALSVSLLGFILVRSLGLVRSWSARLRMPGWSKPAVGALVLGFLCAPLIVYMGNAVHSPGQGLGLLGGGYGAVQLAISGADWLPHGFEGVQLLLLLCIGKIVAASLTIGSGGSAGDFAPSLAVGGLFGGAFGRACQILLSDQNIDPGAFALVGMGTLYGGIAHVPLSALVLVCEMAGSYDLLVPLMLAEGIAFVALRGTYLYPAQVPTARDSPAHRDAVLHEVLLSTSVETLMSYPSSHVSFRPDTPLQELVQKTSEGGWQDVFPVLDAGGQLVGLVTGTCIFGIVQRRDQTEGLLAAHVMQPPASLTPEDHLRHATEVMLQSGLRELPVVDPSGQVVGFLDEADIARSYVDAAKRAEPGG
ncbi:MAG: Chloride channel protein [Myxococcaceae bacterium]|nr:Chloride channel protein [Myxococcaceae bacterium]